VKKGQGICRLCARRDSVEAERAFRARVAELGGTVLEPEWLGSGKRHRVRCAAGHDCTPWPSAVQQGQGICRLCAGKVWNVFYVVADDERGQLKFGITSGPPKQRLGDHARAGYGRVVRLLANLPGDVAPEMERSVLAALRMSGEAPVQGREHFDAAVTALVLDIVDHYPLTGPCPLIPAQQPPKD
jgi:hypothetical protein